jgi:hypothetical protein
MAGCLCGDADNPHSKLAPIQNRSPIVASGFVDPLADLVDVID